MKKFLKRTISLAAAIILLTMAATAFAHGPVYTMEKISRFGTRITLTMKEEGRTIPVWIKDIKFGAGEDGKLAKLYYTRTYSGSVREYIDLDSRILNLPVRVNLISSDTPEEELFSDLSDKKQIEYIAHLHDAGIVSGYPDHTYHPEETITRAEFMVMMINALKLEGSVNDAEHFSDIENHWAKPVLLLAVKNGLLKGYEGNLLKPDAPISIGEASTIISKSFPLTEKINENFKAGSPVTGHWSWPYMKKLLASGIISGTSFDEKEQNITEKSKDITAQSGFLDTNPDTSITRGECAVFLSRALTSF